MFVEIKYQRSKLWKQFGATLVFVVIGVFFFFEGYRMREFPFLLMFPLFMLGAVSLLFTGSLWLFYLKRLFVSDTSIIKYNHEVISAWGREVPLKEILRVEEKGPTVGNWGMLDTQSWLFHLKDGSVWQVPTYQLFTHEEWKKSRSMIRQQVHERGWKAVRKSENKK